MFSLVDDEPPTFANFVAGPNREAISALQCAARGLAHDGVLLWGGEGTGKSHLLHAFVAEALRAGRVSRYFATPAEVDAEVDMAGDAPCVAVDDIDRADAAAEARLFTLFNAVRERGGAFAAASRVQASRTALRDDLRTRLGWGLTFEIRALADADKPAALAVYARGRGFELGDETIAYLLAHGRRDIGSLTAAIHALDRISLSTRRAISVPLLREWMAAQR